MAKALKRLNIGCGQSPTPGWINYDNSAGIRLGNVPLLGSLLTWLQLIDQNQREFIEFAKSNDIRWADGASRIPLTDGSVEVLYTSHMLEHLDSDDATHFLQEAYRVLGAGGIIRVAVPDLRRFTQRYLADDDADGFIARTHLGRSRPRTLRAKLRFLLVGDRSHHWMYDGNSLCRLLSSIGFLHPAVLGVGETTIADPGALNLHERSDESVYVEAMRPGP